MLSASLIRMSTAERSITKGVHAFNMHESRSLALTEALSITNTDLAYTF
jgi:hypothetical protein